MKEMDKAYNPNEHEQEIYSLWEESGAFTPKIPEGISASDKSTARLTGSQANAVKTPFVISMPPPNVTGKLHIGHALFVTLQDIMTRYHRMKGEPTLWLPGTDHAGIATQNVVEKALRKERLTKHDLGREKFVERVWEWKKEYGGEITRQLRRIGASCDWSRERFTLDEGLSEAVNVAFKQLYEKDLIYRGEYIVNWCPRCATAISDDEVEHKTQVSKLYFFKYDHNFPITIATTRPETKFGDTGVAVNPNDPRYKDFIGKEYEINLDGVKRKIKIFADRAIDKEFGTGAVGVTPAHSMVDWKMADDNDLEKIKVIDEHGRMTEQSGKYADLKVSEAREKLVEYLRNEGLLEQEKDLENNLSICYRCGGAIEPLPSLQWFVKMKPLAERAKKAVESGEIKIVPKRFEKVYFHWMDNIHDWCISRQLWWGHRIPVWYGNSKGKSEKVKVKSWDLKIYGKDIFDGIKKGTKTIELRAGKPKDAEKYWGDFKKGNVIEFSLADEKTDNIITETKSVKRAIKDVRHFDNFDELFKNYKPEQDYPGTDKEGLIDWWLSRPAFRERIEKYGIWVFELENCDNEKLDENLKFKIPSDDIYVGTTAPEGDGWTQEEDVLDTWFSSALWPFSTLGWPKASEAKPEAPRSLGEVGPSSAEATEDKTPDCRSIGLDYASGITDCDYDYFFPTTVMETGYDILFFWVARMIMMGLELTDKPPFKTVYLHGLVRDEQNRKLSKSLGNGIDPIDVSEKFGTDALRMSLVVGATAGNDICVGESKIKGYRNFSNKIWNISRFILMNLESEKLKVKSEKLNFTDKDRKDLEKFEEITKQVTKNLDEFKFSQAGEILYDYTWHEFADKIIEESKDRLNCENEAEKQATQAKLFQILLGLLKMLHPLVPFVTETIWQQIPRELKDSELLVSAKWPGL